MKTRGGIVLTMMLLAVVLLSAAARKSPAFISLFPVPPQLEEKPCERIIQEDCGTMQQSLVVAMKDFCVGLCPPAPGQVETAISRGVAYLEDELNPQLGLLRESPVTAPITYWLATDNQLAAYALRCAGRPNPADSLEEALAQYGHQGHGLIEALVGQDIEWPPRTEVQFTVAVTNGWRIMDEVRSGSVYTDWVEYADLRLYGALDAFNEGDLRTAREEYRKVLWMFNGIGFPDKAYGAQKYYTTYKLALAIYVGSMIGEPTDSRLLRALLAKQSSTGEFYTASVRDRCPKACSLLAKQSSTGGFYTLYNSSGQWQGDTSTETTAYALLALRSIPGESRNISTLASCFTVLPSENLVPNWSVETEGDITGWPADWHWSISNATWADQGYTGAHSLRINVSNATGEWRSQPFAVQANEKYWLSAWVKGMGSAQTFLTIRWWSNPDGTGFIGENNIPLYQTYADWTMMKQGFTAPATAQSADIMFRCPAATTADIYGDDFRVRLGNRGGIR